jgi:peroxiredoxin
MADRQTTAELDAARDHHRNDVIPAAALAVMDAETDALAASGLYTNALKVGDRAPDVLLPDASGRAVRLYDLLADGPVVLTFYRGGWCPYCNIALRGLQRELPRFRARGARLVAVSPQIPDASLTVAERNALEFPVLSDVGGHAARAFGVSFRLSERLRELYRTFGHPLEAFNGAENGAGLPVPATFVIAPDGVIRYAFVDADYTRRADPEDIVAALGAGERVPVAA